MINDQWRKSTYSNSQGGDCVECRASDAGVQVRDSRHPEHGHLDFPAAAWRAFLAEVDAL